MGKPAFDPSKPFEPVAQTEAPATNKPAFDPTQPFEPAKAPERPWYSITPGGVAQAFKEYLPSIPHGELPHSMSELADQTYKGAMNTIPAAGAVLGGMVGGPIGAGAGAAAGQSLKSTIQSAISGQSPTRGEFYSDLGTAAKQGVAGQMLGESGAVVGKAAVNKLSGVPSELTGIPDKDIETYAQRADKVNEIISDHSDNGKFNSQLAVNHMRDNVLNDVSKTRMHLDNQISEALKSAPQDKVFSAEPIKKVLAEEASRLHPVYGENDIGQIQGLIEKIDKTAPDGKMSIQDLQATKRYLQNEASGSYKDGNFFRIGDSAANAAKMAGRVARETMDKYGPVEIKNANRQLSQLHQIEDGMSAQLLNKNSPPNSMLSAGTGANVRDMTALSNLGEITGADYLGDAQNISAARSFSNTPIFTKTTTGRSMIGPIYGRTLGEAVAGKLGGYVGQTAGAALSSPAMLKAGIDSGSVPAGIGKSIMSTTIRSGVGKK